MEEREVITSSVKGNGKEVHRKKIKKHRKKEGGKLALVMINRNLRVDGREK